MVNGGMNYELGAVQSCFIPPRCPITSVYGVLVGGFCRMNNVALMNQEVEIVATDVPMGDDIEFV